MRLKRLGFSAIGLAALLTLAWSSAAMATSTALCKVHQEPCAAPNLVTTVDLSSTSVTILNPTVTVLCLAALLAGTVLGLASPQIIHATEFKFTGCGTKASHDNCTFTVLELPLLSLLKTALNLATATATSGKLQAKCKIFLNCCKCTVKLVGLTLSMEGAHHTASAGHGMLTANKLPLEEGKGEEEGGETEICASTTFLDALFEFSEDVFAVS